MKKVGLIFLALAFFGLKMNAQSYSTLELPNCEANSSLMMAKTSIFSVSFGGANFTDLILPNGQTIRLNRISLSSKHDPTDYEKQNCCNVFEGSVNGKTYVIGRTEVLDYNKFVTKSIYAICNAGEKCPGRQEIIEHVRSIARNKF